MSINEADEPRRMGSPCCILRKPRQHRRLHDGPTLYDPETGLRVPSAGQAAMRAEGPAVWPWARARMAVDGVPLGDGQFTRHMLRDEPELADRIGAPLATHDPRTWLAASK